MPFRLNLHFVSTFCFQTEQFIVMWLLFILIVFGNSAVLAALLLDRTRAKSRMNFFIMHLAIAGKNKQLVEINSTKLSVLVIQAFLWCYAQQQINFFQNAIQMMITVSIFDYLII